MAETFAERKAAAPAPVEKDELASRVIMRGPVELHSPIDTLGRSAEHMRIPAEGTYHSAAQAESKMRIASNVHNLRLEGTAPLPERLIRALQEV